VAISLVGILEHLVGKNEVLVGINPSLVGKIAVLVGKNSQMKKAPPKKFRGSNYHYLFK